MSLFDEILSHSYFTETPSDIVNIYDVGFGDAKFTINKSDKSTYTKKQWYDLLARFNEDWYEYSDWQDDLCNRLKSSWANNKLNGFGNKIDINQYIYNLRPTMILVTTTPGIVNIHCVMDLGEAFENDKINVDYKYEYDEQNNIFRLVKDGNNKNPFCYESYMG